MSTEESIRTPVRRRERGERRIAQIIGAAEEVLVERGYERTTTNAIAERAGISPGSLYQFFRNKDEIAEALAGRYSEVFASALDHAFLAEVAGLSTEALVDRTVDTLIEVNIAHPALRTVFRGWDAPPALAEAIRPLQQGIIDRVLVIVERRMPLADDGARRAVALTTVEIFRALVPHILQAGSKDRSAITRELKRALVSYIVAVEHDAASLGSVEA